MVNLANRQNNPAAKERHRIGRSYLAKPMVAFRKDAPYIANTDDGK